MKLQRINTGVKCAKSVRVLREGKEIVNFNHELIIRQARYLCRVKVNIVPKCIADNFVWLNLTNVDTTFI